MGGGEQKLLRLPSVQAVQDVAPPGGYKDVSYIFLLLSNYLWYHILKYV